jgi:ribosomal protein S12 methylthiotransferase
MEAAQLISRRKLREKVGRRLQVLVDTVRRDGVAIARSKGDAPEIDGHVFVKPGSALAPGDLLEVRVTRTEAYDLWAEPVDPKLRLSLPSQRPSARLHRVISRS